jgi:ABC-type branched-subunit amino acid transport system permease subunit
VPTTDIGAIALIGAVVFTLLLEILRGSANWRYVLFAAAVIVLMALRPQGLVTGEQMRRLLGLHRHGIQQAEIAREPSA